MLPRGLAATITVSAVAQASWAVALAVLILTVVGLSILLSASGDAADLTGPVAVLFAMLALLVTAALRPSRWTLLLYVVGGGICVYLFLMLLLGAHPELMPEAIYLLNRPALALVLVGVASPRPLAAVGWGIAGYASGIVAMVVACLQLGLPVITGFGATLGLLSYGAVFIAIAIVQRVQRDYVPDVGRMEAESRRLESQRRIDQRAVALIHDTVLNDLALAMNGPDALDSRTRARMRDDVALLESAEWARSPQRVAQRDPRDAEFRNRLMKLISDFQWRGLRVDLAGDTDAALRLSPAAATAALGAVRACLENVLSHSGTTSAELVLGRNDQAVTIMVVDSGVGFDPAAVDDDRLGLRASVVQRVESSAGHVRVWSTVGHGTSVLISLPLAGSRLTEADDADDD